MQRANTAFASLMLELNKSQGDGEPALKRVNFKSCTMTGYHLRGLVLCRLCGMLAQGVWCCEHVDAAEMLASPVLFFRSFSSPATADGIFYFYHLYF